MVLVVLLALGAAACSDEERVDTAPTTAPDDTSDADALVATAFEAVLGDGPFRSRVSGSIPFFLDESTTVYEQSGGESLAIGVRDSFTLATAMVDEVVHEWNPYDGSWRQTPLDEYDPFPGPEAAFGNALTFFLDFSGDAPDPEDPSDWEPVTATGWTEVESGPDGLRRFERPVDPAFFESSEAAEDAEDAEDVPDHWVQRRAVENEFFRQATGTLVVELDADLDLARAVVRFEYGGSPEHPDCEPLAEVVGTTEQVVEFSDIGADFTITVPEPAEMLAEYPTADDELDVDELTGEPLEQDLTGCPTT